MDRWIVEWTDGLLNGLQHMAYSQMVINETDAYKSHKKVTTITNLNRTNVLKRTNVAITL